VGVMIVMTYCLNGLGGCRKFLSISFVFLKWHVAGFPKVIMQGMGILIREQLVFILRFLKLTVCLCCLHNVGDLFSFQ
jgi:hypothetical protein